MFENVDWFSFIVGGIFVNFVINIVSSFAQPKIESWLEKFSTSRQLRNSLVKEMFDAEVEKLVTNSHEELVARHKANSRLIILVTMHLTFLIFLVSVLITDILLKDIILILGYGTFNLLLLKSFVNYPNTIHSILKKVDERKKRIVRNLERYASEKLKNTNN